jgi:hypothetical protein
MRPALAVFCLGLLLARAPASASERKVVPVPTFANQSMPKQPGDPALSGWTDFSVEMGGATAALLGLLPDPGDPQRHAGAGPWCRAHSSGARSTARWSPALPDEEDPCVAR